MCILCYNFWILCYVIFQYMFLAAPCFLPFVALFCGNFFSKLRLQSLDLQSCLSERFRSSGFTQSTKLPPVIALPPALGPSFSPGVPAAAVPAAAVPLAPPPRLANTHTCGAQKSHPLIQSDLPKSSSPV